MKSRKILLVFATIISILVVFAAPGFAAKIRVSHEMSPDPYEPTHGYFLVLKHYIEALTDIEVEIYPANVLGGMEAVIEQVAEGDIHIAQVSVGGMSNYYKKALVYNLPYAYPQDQRILYRLWDRDNEFSKKLYQEIEDEVRVKAIQVIMRGGFAVISNNVRPIRNLNDTAGIQLRAMDVSQIELYRALGADGIVVPWEEVYTALQTGVVDGQMNPVNIFLDASFHEVQKYITFPGTFPATGIIIVSPDWYYSLTPEDQMALDIAFENASRASQGLSLLSEALALERLHERGVQVYHQTAEEYDSFREAGLNGIMDWAYKTFGEGFVKEFLNEIDRLERELSQ